MKRIKYISRFSKAHSSDDIKKLADSAVENNKRDGITGIFMVSGDLFFQIIEGPEAEVDQLMERIKNDDRHKDMLVLSVDENIKKRIFPDWSMRKVDISDEASSENNSLKAIMETIFIQKRVLANLTETIERAIWHRLVK